MPESYEQLRDAALANLKNLMDTLQSSPSTTGKGKILAYWLNDYARLLQSEQSFDPKKLIRYKRGSIVKVHLGYNIGSEEGGLHYAVVMDNAETLSSPTVTVIPLTSIKPNFDLSKMHFSRVFLGDEVYRSLNANLESELSSAKMRLTELTKKSEELTNDKKATPEEMAAIREETSALFRTIRYCQKMSTEVDRMKTGSIALVGQITTLSKIRIYDPRYHNDALAEVRVSNATLDKLDQKITELFLHPNEPDDSE